MSIAVTASGARAAFDETGVPLRRGSLAITGLTANSDNTVPHGLPFIPTRISLRPGSGGLWGEKQAPDATNVYIHVATGGATAGTVDYEEA